MKKVAIVRGIEMPFFPMRPSPGVPLRDKQRVLDVLAEIKDGRTWLVQPKLNDARATLALLNGRIYVQNRHGRWFAKPILNLDQWRELPNKTVLDGGVYKNRFYAFEALAMNGKSLLCATAAEREVLAFQMSRLCCVAWLFDRPTRGWLCKLGRNMPMFEGVVFKRLHSPYIIAGSESQTSPLWFKRRWA